MTQVIYALQYAYLYFSARKNSAPPPMLFSGDNDTTVAESQVEFADFFYVSVE